MTASVQTAAVSATLTYPGRSPDQLLPQLGARRSWPLPRYRISVCRADGSSSERSAIGGHTSGHVADAIEDAGLGGQVRVIRLHELDVA